MSTQTYLVALGGNVRGRAGTPARLLATLLAGGFDGGFDEAARIGAASSIHRSAPLGHGARTYANAVALIQTELMPSALLARLKLIERRHGRRPGRRWGSRTLDLDIIGWSGGRRSTRTLTIPHRAFRERLFVLKPLAEIVPGWRDPVTGLAVRHLLARALKRVPDGSALRGDDRGGRERKIT